MLSQADTRDAARCSVAESTARTNLPCGSVASSMRFLPTRIRVQRIGRAPSHGCSLTAQGELADQVKWKLGARVDVDTDYFDSNFYLDPVKKNQRFDAFYRENYLDFSAGDWDFRLGAQQISGAKSSDCSLPTWFRRWTSANSCCPASTSYAFRRWRPGPNTPRVTRTWN